MNKPSKTTRRGLIAGALAFGALAACDNGIGGDGAMKIDDAADTALNYLYGTAPATRELGRNATGILIVPQISQAGLGLGAAYGRGVLRINDIPVDYYSSTQGSFGLQIGAQQFSQVLFFMTEDALAEFRASSGWTAGAGARYALNSDAMTLGLNTSEILHPIEAVIFAQAGFIAGATIEGTKYTRIIP